MVVYECGTFNYYILITRIWVEGNLHFFYSIKNKMLMASYTERFVICPCLLQSDDASQAWRAAVCFCLVWDLSLSHQQLYHSHLDQHGFSRQSFLFLCHHFACRVQKHCKSQKTSLTLWYCFSWIWNVSDWSKSQWNAGEVLCFAFKFPKYKNNNDSGISIRMTLCRGFTNVSTICLHNLAGISIFH